MPALRPLSKNSKRLLTEEVSTGGAPEVPGREPLLGPGIAAQTGTLAVHPSQEYVAGSLADPMFAYARALPEYIDNRTQVLGADLYEKMALDPHIAGESMVYKLAVLAGGVQLLPALDGRAIDEGEDGYALAKEVADLCQGALDELETALTPVLLDMLSAFGLGNRVAEVVYREEEGRTLSLPGLPTLSQPARLMLGKLKPKHRSVVSFVVDNRKNHIGYLGALAGRAQYVTRPEVIVDLKATPNLLPLGKFMKLTWWESDADPRGRSQYEPAYDAWWLKQNTLAELAKFIAQFAGAGMVAQTAQGAQKVKVKDPVTGQEVVQDPAQQLLTSLLAFRNGAALVVPHGSEVKNLVATGAGAPFFQALDTYDKQISKAILGQTLATNEGKRDNRASSGNAKDVLDLIIEHGEQLVADMLRRLLRWFVLLNRGDVYAQRLLPLVNLSGAEEADWAQLATAGASLSQHLAPNQWAWFTTKKLSLPQPEGQSGAEIEAEELKAAPPQDGIRKKEAADTNEP